ncbi:MAG: hypothetical protein JSW00_14425 [Thermoplasmata archaeon]|nr:MAG: hypothetical protein JSW00_14425 [Thermoplasmata archaeon]
MDGKLIFIYNADSGIISSVSDYFHKIVKPDTYQCNLCALTYGNLGMKTQWKDFIENLEISVEFFHKDEFKSKYPWEKAKFPSAYIFKDSELYLLIAQKDMNQLHTLDELINLVNEKLKEFKDKQDDYCLLK